MDLAPSTNLLTNSPLLMITLALDPSRPEVTPTVYIVGNISHLCCLHVILIPSKSQHSSNR